MTQSASARPTLSDGLELAEALRGLRSEPSGLLAASVDVRTGRIVDSSPIPDELGDYVQYVDRLGERTGADWCRSWALEQARRAIELCEIDAGWVRCRVERRWLNWVPHVSWVSLVGSGDFYLGLSALYERTRAAWLLEAFDRFLNRILQQACHGQAPVYGLFVQGGRPVAAVPMTEPMTAAYLIEAAMGFHRGSADARFLDAASCLASGWPALETFRARGLFSRTWHGPRWARPLVDWQFRARRRPPLDATIFVKGDTMLVMSMLALGRQRAEPWIGPTCRAWAQAALRTARQADGSFRTVWFPGAPAREQPQLGENHSWIECLIDLGRDLAIPDCLDAARSCAEFWLSQQSAVGLIPAHPGARLAHLDPQIDLAVQLYRLSEATAEHRWADAADDLLAAVWHCHRVGRLISQTTDVTTGSPASDVVETKFLGSFLKAVLVADAVETGASLFEDESLRALTADR